ETRTGTSISGPTTPASACPEVAPKTPTATAIASSKSFEATVKARLAVCAYGSLISFPIANPTRVLPDAAASRHHGIRDVLVRGLVMGKGGARHGIRDWHQEDRLGGAQSRIKGPVVG